MTRTRRMPREVRRQILTVLLLLALLLGLAAAYWFLTRPPQAQSAERDRRFLFSIYGFEGDLLRRPTGVGFDDAGNLYVADTGKKRIVVFDEDGVFLKVFGEAGKDPLQLWNPIDVEVTPDGRAFVVDRSQSKVVEYDTVGRAVRDIKTEEPPTSIAIRGESMFVTTDSGVLIADLEGVLQTGYIRRGREPGAFDRPGGVAVGSDGTIYVADSLNYRVQAIGTDGKPKWAYGAPIPRDKAIQYDADGRKFGLPASIAVDDNDLVYVVDGLNHEIQVLDAQGEPQETIGDTGHEDGMFYYPDGIDYHSGRLAVADKYNDRVEVFAVPMPLGKSWTAFLPWLALLLLLPLLALLLPLRRQRYVMTADAVDTLLADTEREDMAAALKQLTTTPEVGLSGREAADFDLKWLDGKFKESDANDLADRYTLSVEDAAALAVASALRGKKVLVGDGAGLVEAAADLGVPLLGYAEFRDALLGETADSESADEQDSFDDEDR